MKAKGAQGSVFKVSGTETPYSMERMWLYFGYKERDSIQIRLDDEKDVFFSMDTPSHHLKNLTVPLEVVVSKWPDVMKMMEEAKAEYEATNPDEVAKRGAAIKAELDALKKDNESRRAAMTRELDHMWKFDSARNVEWNQAIASLQEKCPHKDTGTYLGCEWCGMKMEKVSA